MIAKLKATIRTRLSEAELRKRRFGMYMFAFMHVYYHVGLLDVFSAHRAKSCFRA